MYEILKGGLFSLKQEIRFRHLAIIKFDKQNFLAIDIYQVLSSTRVV